MVEAAALLNLVVKFQEEISSFETLSLQLVCC